MKFNGVLHCKVNVWKTLFLSKWASQYVHQNDNFDILCKLRRIQLTYLHSICPVHIMVGDNRLWPWQHPIQAFSLILTTWLSNIYLLLVLQLQNAKLLSICLILIIRKTQLCFGSFFLNVYWASSLLFLLLCWAIYTNANDQHENILGF